MLSLSTMWGVGRFQRMGDFLDVAQGLGVAQLELNYNATEDMIEAILRAPGVAISSVHLPCPHAQYNGLDAYRVPLNSEDEDERQAALRFARAGIELAARVGAQVAVVHAGRVPGCWPAEDSLRQLYRQGQVGSEAYQSAKEQLVELRAKNQEPALDLAFRSLRELAAYARQHGVTLGLESRYYYCEIPNLEEAELLLGEFPGVMGYCHDTGHVENQARLGFVSHQEWLRRLGHRLVEVHLHDIEGLDDHRAPGRGSLDWDMLARHLRQDVLFVLELNHYNNADDVQAGMLLLGQKGILQEKVVYQCHSEEPT